MRLDVGYKKEKPSQKRIQIDYLAVSLTVCTLWIGVILLSSAAVAYNRALEIVALVAARRLPPMDKRLPQVLVRIIPAETRGVYGGT